MQSSSRLGTRTATAILIGQVGSAASRPLRTEAPELHGASLPLASTIVWASHQQLPLASSLANTHWLIHPCVCVYLCACRHSAPLAEFRRALKLIGVTATPVEVNALFAHLDANHDGRIVLDELEERLAAAAAAEEKRSANAAEGPAAALLRAATGSAHRRASTDDDDDEEEDDDGEEEDEAGVEARGEGTAPHPNGHMETEWDRCGAAAAGGGGGGWSSEAPHRRSAIRSSRTDLRDPHNQTSTARARISVNDTADAMNMKPRSSSPLLSASTAPPPMPMKPGSPASCGLGLGRPHPILKATDPHLVPAVPYRGAPPGPSGRLAPMQHLGMHPGGSSAAVPPLGHLNGGDSQTHSPGLGGACRDRHRGSLKRTEEQGASRMLRPGGQVNPPRNGAERGSARSGRTTDPRQLRCDDRGCDDIGSDGHGWTVQQVGGLRIASPRGRGRSPRLPPSPPSSPPPPPRAPNRTSTRRSESTRVSRELMRQLKDAYSKVAMNNLDKGRLWRFKTFNLFPCLIHLRNLDFAMRIVFPIAYLIFVLGMFSTVEFGQPHFEALRQAAGKCRAA